MRLLVLRPGALGDLLLALPAVRTFMTRLPSTQVEMAASHPAVLGLAPDVRAAHDFGSALFSPLFVETGPPCESLSRFLSRFDQVAVLAGDRDGLVRGRLLAHGVGWAIGGTLESRPVRPPHMSVRLALQLGLDGLPDGARRARLLELGRPVGQHVWLHPGAGGASKRWPLEAFAALARLLAAEGLPVRLLAGPADEDLGECLAGMLGMAGTSVVRPGTHLELASELAGGLAFVGNDTGPAHLAGLLGLPTVAVFGPTAPEVWAPCGPRASAVAAGQDGRWPSAAAVAEALLGEVRGLAGTGSWQREGSMR